MRYRLTTRQLFTFHRSGPFGRQLDVTGASGIALCLTMLAGCGATAPAGGDPPASPSTQPAAEANTAAVGPRARTVQLRYIARIAKVPEGVRRLDLWVPVPASTAVQTVTDEQVDSPFPYRIEAEEEYGNRVLHVWTDQPHAAAVSLRFHCSRRREQVPPDDGAGVAPSTRLLQPDRLGVIDNHIRQLAGQITAGQTGTRARARAIYDYVVSTMDYDKTTPGWGNGDTLRACDVRKGNCTDFHALFISLARASAIPAKFDIGVALPEDKDAGKIAGYHCWAEFWDPVSYWTPVDCSEARQHPDRHDFYFGGLTASRVQLSGGRDLSLPGMQGQRLNYFLSPYAEVDGKPLAGVEREVTFQPEGEPGNR